MLFFRNVEKAEGGAKGCHCELEFISMLRYFVCLLFVSSVIFFSLSFFFFFSFSPSPFKGTTSIWMEYRITLLVCLRLRLFIHVDLLHDHFYAGREKL